MLGVIGNSAAMMGIFSNPAAIWLANLYSSGTPLGIPMISIYVGLFSDKSMVAPRFLITWRLLQFVNCPVVPLFISTTLSPISVRGAPNRTIAHKPIVGKDYGCQFRSHPQMKGGAHRYTSYPLHELFFPWQLKTEHISNVNDVAESSS